jgi:hypothetical protein
MGWPWGFGEVEVQLCHDGDTPGQLRARLLEFMRFWPQFMVSSLGINGQEMSPTVSFTVTGHWTTRGPTVVVAESTMSSRFCAKPVATPTSPCHRLQTRHKLGRLIASIMPSMTPSGPSHTTWESPREPELCPPTH